MDINTNMQNNEEIVQNTDVGPPRHRNTGIWVPIFRADLHLYHRLNRYNPIQRGAGNLITVILPT